MRVCLSSLMIPLEAKERTVVMAFKEEQVRTGVSSEEKGTWIVGVSLVLIFGWYFTKILMDAVCDAG